MRMTLRVAAAAAGLILCLPPHYLWKLFVRHTPWPRRFLRWAGYCFGLRIRIAGTPLRDNVLFVSNHVSWLDILALGGTPGTAFVAKGEVEGYMLIGWLADLNDTVYVARQERRSVHGQAGALRVALAAGRPVALFPEGTTDGGLEVLPFRPSLLAALFPSLPQLLVQPVAIDYGGAGEEIAWVGEEGAIANAKRVLSRRGTIPTTLRFLAPIDPHGAGDRKALAAAARDEIVAALGASAAGSDPLYGRQ